jgi:hypothetical protein
VASAIFVIEPALYIAPPYCTAEFPWNVPVIAVVFAFEPIVATLAVLIAPLLLTVAELLKKFAYI